MSACKPLVAVTFVLLVSAPQPSAAQTSRGDGSQTGDGSTPFTGLAQAPEANLFVGAATTSIPFQVPPGRNTTTPKLALSYNSNGGPSPYGYGWELGLPRVQRPTKHSTLSCLDATHRNDFVLSLPGASLECRRGTDNRCVPNVEEAFIKIVWDGGTAQTFTAWDKSGVKYTFGANNTASTNGGVSFTSPARTGSGTAADFTTLAGGNCTYTATWGLSQVRDTNGNIMDFKYLLQDGVLLPHSIEYGKGTGLNHFFEVRFDWELRCLSPVGGRCSIQSPPAGDYEEPLNSVMGYAARLTRRLWKVRVLYNGQPVRTYTFDYATGRFGRQTFLSQVTLAGSDGMVLQRVDGLPAATTFAYHDRPDGFLTSSQTATKPALRTPYNGLSPDPGRMRWTDPDDGTRRDVLDMNGDGFPDLVDAWPIHQQSDGCPGVPTNPVGPADYWDVYFGSKNGFSTTRTSWYVPHRDLMCDIRRNNDTIVWFATVDLTGDGIPDFVDSRNTPWKVYPGSPVSPSGSWGFNGGASVISWPAPTTNTQITNVGQNLGGWSGKIIRQDLIDMTGDGLLDLVTTPAGQPAPNPTIWTVARNTGSGFAAVENFQGAFGALTFLSQNANDNGTIYGTWDINGDGLPDGVYSQQPASGGPVSGGAWRVCLNTGRAMDVCENWPVPQHLISQGDGSSWRHIRKNGAEPQDALRDFFDVNGDGLPDLIDRVGFNATTNPNWRFLLNRGDGFEPASFNWPTPYSQIRGSNAGGGSTLQDSFDINGDGLVDFINWGDGGATTYFVYPAAGGAWTPNGATVIENVTGYRPDLLVMMENGIGGDTTLRYRPSTQWDNTGGDGIPDLPFVVWTLTEIRRDDGMCNGASCITPGAHEVATLIDYKYGRYDPLEREFRGFAEVVSEELISSPSTPRRGTHTYFHQTAALSGKIQQVYTYDASNDQTWFWQPIALTANSWECANPSTGAIITCPSQPLGNVWSRLALVEERTFTNFSLITYKSSFTRNVSWHQCGGKFYGNVNHAQKGSLAGADRIHTYTDYACADTTSAYVVDKPIKVKVRNHDDSATVEEKWFFYDTGGYGTVGAGNVTRIESWLNQTDMSAPPACTNPPSGGSGGCATTAMAYDAYGNLTTVTDALGRVTTTTYDGTNQIYPTLVTAPLSHKVSTTYDPACGTLRTESVKYTGSAPPASDYTDHRYDTFCRLERTYRPGEPRDATATPYRRYVYKLGAPQTPSVIASHLREPNHPSGQSLLATSLSDALGRTIQQKTESVVAGLWVGVATSTTDYDTLGRPQTQYAPFSLGSAPGVNYETLSAVPAGTGTTTLLYDAVARPTQVTHPDGTYRTVEHGVAWETTTKDECFNAASCPGGKFVEKRDALGRTTEKWAYEEGDVLKARTRYEYDVQGRLTKSTQGDATSWNNATDIEITYDSLGRKQSTKDPDAGAPNLWRYRYDWVGNLIFQDDPRTGQSLRFCYDALNRVEKKLYKATDYPTLPTCTLSSPVILYTYDIAGNGVGRLYRVDDLTGASVVEQYTLLGQPEFVQRIVNTVTTETVYSYDAADHVTSIRYPDNELVLNVYDAAGRIIQVKNGQGGPIYLQGMTYDILGRPMVITHGNGTTDTRSYGTTATTNYRLNRIQAQAGSTVLNYNYASYWPGGQLKKLIDEGPKPAAAMDATVDQYNYDGIGRLKDVDLPGASPSRIYTHDIWGNLTRQDTVTINYDGVKKHTPTNYNDGQSGTFTHDTSGNRTLKALGRPDQQAYTYDADNRLSRIVVGADTVDLGYDHGGRRTKETWNGVTTHHLTEFLAVTGSTLRKYYFAGDLLIASREGATPPGLILARAESPIEVVQSGAGRPIMIVRLDHSTALGIGCAMVIGGGLVFLLLPHRRRSRVLGLRIRPADAVVVATALLIGTLPWTLAVRPANAQPTPTPTPVPTAAIHHYHLDHLGSPQTITTGTGTVYQHLRYMPYGDLRGTWSAGGGSGGPTTEQDRHLFTGYELEPRSNLHYAGARFYDADFGLFLTHDPARQFANPYTYTNWDPINRTDPSGAFTGIELATIAAVAFVAGFAAGAIQAAVNGASFPEALKAGAISGAIAGVSAPIGAVVLQYAIGPALGAMTGLTAAEAADAAGTALFIGNLGQTAYGLSQGDYSGIISLGISVGLGVALTQGADTSSGTKANKAYANANAGGVDEVDKARLLGYKPQQHDWKILHAGRTYHWTLKAAEFLFGTSSGPLGYLGRLLVTPFVTVGGVAYELHAAFNPFGERFLLDKQSIPDWLFDTPGDLIANTYGQAVALTPGLSPAAASNALQAAGWIPGPNHLNGEGFFKISAPGLGF